MSAPFGALPGLADLGRGLDRADARQLLRLRELQLRRARSAVAEASDHVSRAQQALDHRQARVTRTRAARAELLTDIAGRLAARLPQWAPWASAHRAWLDDQLEREEYALINDERVLEQAQDRLAERRRELARCEHRESLAAALLDQQRRHRARGEERRQDAEREDRATGDRAW